MGSSWGRFRGRGVCGLAGDDFSDLATKKSTPSFRPLPSRTANAGFDAQSGCDNARSREVLERLLNRLNALFIDGFIFH
jgi:hypothetical protein